MKQLADFDQEDLENGLKIRLKSWKYNEYICHDKPIGKWFDESGNDAWRIIVTEFFSDNWEEYRKPVEWEFCGFGDDFLRFEAGEYYEGDVNDIVKDHFLIEGKKYKLVEVEGND